MIENKTDEKFILCKLRELPFQFFIKLLNIIRFSVDLIMKRTVVHVPSHFLPHK